MKYLWHLTADQTILFYELLEKVEANMKRELTGQEKELVFLKLMESEGIKTSGGTELNNEELIKEITSKGKSILNIDKNGFMFIKKKKDKE